MVACLHTFILLGLTALAHGLDRDSGSRGATEAFAAIGDLKPLSHEQFTRIGHPAFPNHSVRVKKSRFCDGNVNAYTGYIDVQAHHLFFFLFESRRDPANDDVIMWTNGGPGGSSSLGMLMELGPCRVTGPNSTEPFKYAWNERANVFFIDQPIGTGFSYADNGEIVSSTKDAAKDIAAFVAIFFEHFTQFKGRPFHMAGESYGGRYLPVFASELVDQNARFVQQGLPTVDLASVMIGNGITDWPLMFPSFYAVQCLDTEYGPPLNTIASCVQIKAKLPRCEKRLQESCIDIYDAIDCKAAFDWCIAATVSKYYDGDINPYDRTFPGKGGNLTTWYPIVVDIGEYLSEPAVQAALGVDAARRGPYSAISMDVNAAFEASGDMLNFRAQHYVGALLERGVRVLFYVGANDIISNPIGTERLVLDLEWHGKAAFAATKLRPWTINGETVGRTRGAGRLTFATVYGAGHTAPYDQPERVFELANRWIAGEEL